MKNGGTSDRQVQLLYFAWLRERVGRSEEHFALPPDVATLGALIMHLAARDAGSAAAFERPELVRAAINQVFAKPEATITPGDEIAFFPPVTGG